MRAVTNVILTYCVDAIDAAAARLSQSHQYTLYSYMYACYLLIGYSYLLYSCTLICVHVWWQ